VLERRADVLRRSLEADPEDPTAWYGLGRALAGLRRPREAADAFRRAVAVRPSYTAAWRELGSALLAAGEPAEAEEALERGARAAQETGDLQTGREIEVFLRRARRKRR